jgi:hypothetical protein
MKTQQPPMTMGTVAEQLAALKELSEYGSHQAFDQEEADKITTPFGFKARLYLQAANREPKGLLIEGAKPGEKFYRIGGFDLAGLIASKLGVAIGWQTGRGSRFRTTMANLRQHFGQPAE